MPTLRQFPLPRKRRRFTTQQLLQAIRELRGRIEDGISREFHLGRSSALDCCLVLEDWLIEQGGA